MASVVGERIDEVMAWIRQGQSFRQVATRLDVGESSVRRFFKRNPDLADEVKAIRGDALDVVIHGHTKSISDIDPSIIEENEASILYRHTGSGTDVKSPEEVMQDHGLNPGEWDYVLDARSWDAAVGNGIVTTMHYFKIIAKRKPESRFAFEVPQGWTPPKARRSKTSSTKPRTVAIFADPHAPLNEHCLTEATVAWLEEFQPSEFICLGDAADNSPFKRHKVNKRIDCTPKEAIWSTYELLARWVNAAPDARRRMIFGNHDHWILDRILETNADVMDIVLYGEDEPYMSLGKILKLGELGYEYEWTGGEYHDVTYALTDDLVLMHGTKTGKYGGATKEQEGWEGASVVQGHDHKLTLTAVTKRLPSGSETQRYAVSAGTLARRDLGYDPKRNVNQGWPVVTIWPSGRWHIEYALFDPQTESTTFRDWIWTP